ncbi:ImmA/IrrE family metallo-endopeptidase [Buttiauxella massiliensis]|uniref:ImmA/IrrE family metallo-endopeptidase n=1 Tax=Buttiauxella massiliensis TaxID=2831590 RepID=UPI00125F60A1|nr:ImmA/IrrE family metallo-endopeptidase [Buttiauxella massiliensis]
MNTVKKGDDFEEEVYNLLRDYINSGNFWLNPKFCKFYRKKKYFSKKREGYIIVDISIECFLDGRDDYSQLIVIECKDYKSKIPVDDIEEFESKLHQISGVNIKGIFASRTPFQSGAFKVAKNIGMALIRVLPEDKIDWVLQRNPISSKPAERIKEDRATSEYALNNENFTAKSQNIFCYYNNYTSFIIDILNELLFGDKKPFHKTIPNKYKIIRSKNLSYLSLDEIDSRGLQLALASEVSTKGEIDLLKIVSYLQESDGLNFDLSYELGTDEVYTSVLGSMDAKNNIIKISDSLEFNSHRWRFTLAHEIGHYIFHHDFMLKNKIDEHVDIDDNYSIVEFSMKSNLFRRLEWQANMFANSLLMPRKEVFDSIISLVAELDIRSFNSGIVYVDDQQCNIHNYKYIVSKLKKKFNVSATIVEIRLKQLRILNDKRITPEGFSFNLLNVK